MGKRMRSMRSICACTSPRSRYTTPHPIFNYFEDDIWIEIAKYLGGSSLVMLGCVNRWFYKLIIKEDTIWKYACLRDLQLLRSSSSLRLLHQPASFKWIQIYASAFDGSHSYLFRQQDKHIDWMRIGAFHIETPCVFLTETLKLPWKVPQGDTILKMLQSGGSCILNRIKPGIWIADIQLVRCPVCNFPTCEGTMQTLDVRHVELFLFDGYKNGSWQYEEIGHHDTLEQCESASGAIFDIKHIRDPSTHVVINLKKWAAKPSDWQPRTQISSHAVAVNTNLQKNEGLHVEFHVMRAGAGGEVVAIRISQQLL